MSSSFCIRAFSTGSIVPNGHIDIAIELNLLRYANLSKNLFGVCILHLRTKLCNFVNITRFYFFRCFLFIIKYHLSLEKSLLDQVSYILLHDPRRIYVFAIAQDLVGIVCPHSYKVCLWVIYKTCWLYQISIITVSHILVNYCLKNNFVIPCNDDRKYGLSKIVRDQMIAISIISCVRQLVSRISIDVDIDFSDVYAAIDSE